MGRVVAAFIIAQPPPESQGGDFLSERDEALSVIGNASTLVNCAAKVLMQGDLPKGTTLDDIGSALAMLAERIDEAFCILQG